MRRAVIGSEVGHRFAPGFQAMHEIRYSHPRIRIGQPARLIAVGMAILLGIAALGHFPG